jgi:anti-sigma B factor antagonist
VKLGLEVRAIDGTTILFCHGRFTYREEAIAFSQTVAPLLVENRGLVVEMSGLEIIDSAGLGELVVVHMWANASGCTLKIAGANARILQLFELTNLQSVFDIHPTLDEALLSLRQTAASKTASTAA